MPSPAESSPSHLYVPDLDLPGARIELSEAEGHYLARVCRARSGDRAQATDGRGGLATVRVLEVSPRVRVEIERLDRSVRARIARVWCGAPEGERADWMVEKLAELGIETLQPIHCARASWSKGAARRERWRRLAVAAMKQSRRPFLMDVREPIVLGDAIESAPDEADRWVASAEGETGRRPGMGPGISIGAVGPAAGFAPAERTLLDSRGFRPIRLSDGRLRAETAAVSWAVWWGLGQGSPETPGGDDPGRATSVPHA